MIAGREISAAHGIDAWLGQHVGDVQVDPGIFRPKPASTAGSQLAASDGNSAIDTWPLRVAARSGTPAKAVAKSSSTRRAAGSNSAPSDVSSTVRVVRSNRRIPIESSSWRMSALKAGR